MSRRGLALLTAVLILVPRLAAETPADPQPHPKDPRVVDRKAADWADFRTLNEVVTTRVSRAASVENAQPAYLGVALGELAAGRFVIDVVESGSPAAKAGLQIGDVLVAFDDKPVSSIEQFGNLIRSREPGAEVALKVRRGDEETVAKTTLAATSRPLTLPTLAGRLTIGVRTTEDPQGAKIEAVTTNSAAERSGLKPGDIIVRMDSISISSPSQINDVMTQKKDGDTVALIVRRGEQEIGVNVQVQAMGGRPTSGWDTRMSSLFKKPVYRLAIVSIRYPDVGPNPLVSRYDWEQALFSRGTYIQKSPTGQTVYGSMNDYFLEQSYGQFGVQGKAFDWVQVKRKRAEYANDTNRFALLTEALDLLREREGKDVLEGFDGVFFLYAGDRYQTNRGGLYWPHRSTVFYQGRRLNYFICPEGSRRMDSISVITHEFGHMLGLPDLYARPESPGSEGLGIWCTMATGHGRDGKPLHFSAWCKEQMGWLKPVVIDPTEKQKIVLAPIQASPNECLKVIVRPDGSEYLLLENRAARAFDRDLPNEGLLIWRIVDNRPVLEESHGIAGPEGPNRFLTSVPYPSNSNNAFTPFTSPSSRSLKGGGLPVYITNITRLPDGRISFYIGYEFN